MELVVFLITAVVSIACAIAMIASKNAVHSALFLVLNFASVAVLYLLLNAPFLAMVQITVYAGAIMVLFLFVIMLLGAEKSEGETHMRWQQPLALILGLLLLIEAGYVLFSRTETTPLAAVNAALGSPTELAKVLFSSYLLPFEMTSILLLVALIGAVVLTIKSREKEGA